MNVTLSRASGYRSDLLSLEGRVAVITGGAGVAGSAICRLIAEHGADVVVVDIKAAERRATLASDIESLGRRCVYAQCDCTRSESVAEVARSVKRDFGRIDILINSAGYARPTRFQDLSEQEWRHTVEASMRGAFVCCREFGRIMIRQGAGSIINTASIAGIVGQTRGLAHYSAANGGLISFTRTLAVEWAKYGIRVNCIATGQIVRPSLRELVAQQDYSEQMLDAIPLRRLGQPDEIATAALFLASDACSFINGHTLVVDGGTTIS